MKLGKHIKKIGEIDLSGLVNTCRDQGWLMPIEDYENSPRAFKEIQEVGYSGKSRYFQDNGLDSRPDLNEFRWDHDSKSKVMVENTEPDFIQELCEKYKSKGFRCMCLPPKSTMDYHVDFNNRINIPHITNDSFYYIFEDTLYKLPADGGVYLTNTKVKHTALNGSKDEYRFHLIGYTTLDHRF